MVIGFQVRCEKSLGGGQPDPGMNIRHCQPNNMAVHHNADRSYAKDAIRLIERVSEAHELFIPQDVPERRRLLDFAVSSALWKDGELSTRLRQPFDLIQDGVAMAAEPSLVGSESHQTLRDLDFRTALSS
jgi:hypothetical protein